MISHETCLKYVYGVGQRNIKIAPEYFADVVYISLFQRDTFAGKLHKILNTNLIYHEYKGTFSVASPVISSNFTTSHQWSVHDRQSFRLNDIHGVDAIWLSPH